MDYQKIIGTSTLMEQRRLAGISEEDEYEPLKVGDRVVVTKGLKARGISKGANAEVVKVQDGERGSVNLSLKMIQSQKTYGFYIQHRNRLKKWEVCMNTGDPTKKLCVRRKS